GIASARATGLFSFCTIQEKSSTEAASAPTPAAARAAGRRDEGAQVAGAVPTADVRRSGPRRCEPQRSCSFARFSPCSYVPMEMCSAPSQEERFEPRIATDAVPTDL